MADQVESEPVEDVPGFLTPLIGRDRLLDELANLLRREDVRLVTLVGPGGVGKTRLATEVASQLRNHFTGGVRFVSLAAVVDPAFVLPTIARALGLREVGNRPLLGLLQDELRDRSMLLVVDNFEQILSTAPIIPEFLIECPSVTMLITSRARLAVRGEHLVAVPPLDLPSIADGGTRSPLDAPAVRLLLARTQEATASGPPNPADAEALAEIARRLDGLPLAIELIAARLRVLPPRALRARLERSLTLLSGGPRDLPERQRTMRDAIAWSFDLLSSSEQTLLRRLSVFAGGFTLEGVEGVQGGEGGRRGMWGDLEDEGDERDGGDSPLRPPSPPSSPSSPSVLDGIAALADWSLLVRDEAASNDGVDEPRFSMLETVREFGLERLADAGEFHAMKDAHAAYFAAFAVDAAPNLIGPSQREWLEHIDNDHDNLRAALDWLIERGDAAGALHLASDLWLFWLMRGHLAEGRRRLALVLGMAGGDTSPASRAQVLTGAGALAESQGDELQAVKLLDEAIALARSLDRADLLAMALLFRGVVAFDLDDRAVATAHCLESLELADAVGAIWCGGVSLAQLGLVAIREHEYERGETQLRHSLERFRSLANRWGIAMATGGLGILALDRRQTDRAAQLLAESLMLFQAQGDRWGVAAYLEGAARVAALRHQSVAAARLFGAATALREAVGITVKAIYRASYDQSLAEVRATLGESAFATAWNEGRAMSSAQAVAAAVRSAEAETTRVGQKTTAASDRISLSPREHEVLTMLIDGHSNREIGQALMIGYRTVATHVENICNKLGVNSRTAAASLAVRHGLV